MARIMLVEDDRNEQVLLRTMLEGSGHEVFSANDGEQAFKTYLRQGIELVVTDLQMPRVDGLELIEALRDLYPDASIIAVSGMGAEKLAEARIRGAFAAFKKPVDRDEFLAAIARGVAPG